MLKLDEIRQLAEELHGSVKADLEALGTVRTRAAGTRNKKGDRQLEFDLAAHATVCRILESRFPGATISSEEADLPTNRTARGEYHFVIDPVDGSDNFKRGLPLSAMCVAALPGGAEMAVENVEWSVVGDVNDALPHYALAGAGAWFGPHRLRTSGKSAISDACLSIELNHFAPGAGFAAMMKDAAGIRSHCCTAMAVVLIARGALDAHIDIRRLVTPESYLASALILSEAGGALVDERGNRLAPLRNLIDQRNIIAAATKGLADEITDRVGRSAVGA